METNNKLREALEKCANWGEQIDCQLGSSDETVYAFRDERCLAHNISECARAALAEPVKNCEVGTAEEQFKRHSKWCARTRDFSCAATMCRKCFANWAQMPYDEEGDDK